jgi:5-methylcytosine-specific restriction endonuclease McrA
MLTREEQRNKVLIEYPLIGIVKKYKPRKRPRKSYQCICPRCHVSFIGHNKRQIFCSKRCYTSIYLKKNRRKYKRPSTREQVNKWRKQYRLRHLDQVRFQSRLHSHFRRTAKKGNVVKLSEWTDLLHQCDFTCVKCGKREPEVKLTIDHIKPLRWGGLNVIENIQPLCGTCNCVKHDKTINYLPLFFLTKKSPTEIRDSCLVLFN